MNWLEFALSRAAEPVTVRVEAPGRRPEAVGPCVLARHDGGTTVLCPPDTVAPPGSRIVLPNGEIAEVAVDLHLAALGTRLPGHRQLDLTAGRTIGPAEHSIPEARLR
ncbi:MAG TPA: hypothetical protein VN408_12085 [Actinoplanes sp.]|nr:hypothetical protein [Actinoplanes sp.]